LTPEDADRRSVHWLVRGRVQGVSFRAFVRKQARVLGVEGWVRNLSTGEVEVAARGSASALARLREVAAAGPMLARVDSLDELAPVDPWTLNNDDLAAFEIRSTAPAPESRENQEMQ
jgi:acylphosphatase